MNCLLKVFETLINSNIQCADRIPFTSDYYVTICFDEGPFSAVFDPVPMEEE